MKTPITYYGGKISLASRIISLMPPHKTYCEPFCGGCAVFFAKSPIPLEILNDTNKEVGNFFKVAKRNPKKLERHIKMTPYSRNEYNDAKIIYRNPHMFSSIKRAHAFWIMSRCTFGHDLSSTFSFSKKPGSCTKAHVLSHKRNQYNAIDIAKRLNTVQIECEDAITIIKRYDTANTLFYCDPPYFNAYMGHYGGYTEKDFENLIAVLGSIAGKFILSSYPSDILTEYTKKHTWHTLSFNRQIANSKKGTTKTKKEVLTANHDMNAMSL